MAGGDRILELGIGLALMMLGVFYLAVNDYTRRLQSDSMRRCFRNFFPGAIRAGLTFLKLPIEEKGVEPITIDELLFYFVPRVLVGKKPFPDWAPLNKDAHLQRPALDEVELGAVSDSAIDISALTRELYPALAEWSDLIASPAASPAPRRKTRLTESEQAQLRLQFVKASADKLHPQIEPLMRELQPFLDQLVFAGAVGSAREREEALGEMIQAVTILTEKETPALFSSMIIRWALDAYNIHYRNGVVLDRTFEYVLTRHHSEVLRSEDVYLPHQCYRRFMLVAFRAATANLLLIRAPGRSFSDKADLLLAVFWEALEKTRGKVPFPSRLWTAQERTTLAAQGRSEFNRNAILRERIVERMLPWFRRFDAELKKSALCSNETIQGLWIAYQNAVRREIPDITELDLLTAFRWVFSAYEEHYRPISVLSDSVRAAIAALEHAPAAQRIEAGAHYPTELRSAVD